MWTLTYKNSEPGLNNYTHLIHLKFTNDIGEKMEVGVSRRSGKGVRIISRKLNGEPMVDRELELVSFMPLEIIPDVLQAIREVTELELAELK